MTKEVLSQGVLVFGASGHAKVIIDLIEKTAQHHVRALFDDNLALRGTKIYGYEVMGGQAELLAADWLKNYPAVVAIGSNAIRAKIAAWLTGHGGTLSSALIHPSAQIARGVVLGQGTVVMAGAVMNADSRVGCNVIVNTGALVDHDCVIGDTVHIAPGTTLCGGVKIGNETLIGAGSVVTPNVRIGCQATIGAGASVLNDIEDGLTVVGSPAKPIKQEK